MKKLIVLDRDGVINHDSDEYIKSIRIFSFIIPILFNLVYFGIVLIYFSIGWSFVLWLGTATLSGLIGLLTSFMAFPIQ